MLFVRQRAVQKPSARPSDTQRQGETSLGPGSYGGGGGVGGVAGSCWRRIHNQIQDKVTGLFLVFCSVARVKTRVHVSVISTSGSKIGGEKNPFLLVFFLNCVTIQLTQSNTTTHLVWGGGVFCRGDGCVSGAGAVM